MVNTPPNRPGFPTMVGRALRRRCPWCSGRRAWFTGWFAKADRCHTCGLRWDRDQPGFELGAMSVAVLITGGAIVVLLVVGIITTYPDIAVVPLMLIGFVIAVVVPVLTYPLTYTLWSAFDLAVHPPEPRELEAAARHRHAPSESTGEATGESNAGI